MTDKKRTEIYYPDGRVLTLEWEEGTRPAYEWLSKVVEGYIETVDRFLEGGGPEGTIQAYCNEEGLLRGMRGNVPGMKALNWPEPPGGWGSFDPDNVGEPPPPVVIMGRPTVLRNLGKLGFLIRGCADLSSREILR